MSEVAALRKKYDELVAFTVQLTAQRDVLMTDLEKTYPSLFTIHYCIIMHISLAHVILLMVFLDQLCFDSSTRQLLQKASSDVQRVKKLNEDAPNGGSTLRQRKPGATGATGDDAQLSKTANGVKDPAVRP